MTISVASITGVIANDASLGGNWSVAPVFTLGADTIPAGNAKRWQVTAITNALAGVTTSTVQVPFTLQVSRPNKVKTLSVPLTSGGRIAQVPKNQYRVRINKGCKVNAVSGQTDIASAQIILDIPAGAETADAANIGALLQALTGAISAIGITNLGVLCQSSSF